MWQLDFISRNDFKNHVASTINMYGEKLVSYDIKRFNKNIIDPVKLIFDKTVYRLSWDEIIKNEIFRQRDKSNNNDIGYFHQNIFQYMEYCTVPTNGWDIVLAKDGGFTVVDSITTSRIFVEVKNKHNTMNSSSSAKTYIKMQSQLLSDDDCVCMLVEVIAKKSQNIPWEVSIDGQKKRHKNIRRVSIDKFYELITGQENAFHKMCLELPNIIQEVVDEMPRNTVPNDTVFEALQSKNDNFALALYMLGFSTYNAFNQGDDDK